jgi:hypothetical protein
MPFIQSGGSVIVNVPVNQRILITSYGAGQTKIDFGTAPEQYRRSFRRVAIIENASYVSPIFLAEQEVQIFSAVCEVEYVIGASPVATKERYQPWSVAITGGLVNNTPIGAITPSIGSFTNLSVSGSLLANSANVNHSLSPTGTGSVAIGATGTGSTTLTRLNSLTVVSTDSSGTPGNAIINNLSGRAAFAAASSSVVITNSLVTAGSKVFVSLRGGDTTLTTVRVTPAAGSFTITGNAAATSVTVFDFFVIN